MKNSLLHIAGTKDFKEEERKIFKRICDISDTNLDYAKELYVGILKTAVSHLRPRHSNSDYVYQPTTTSETRFWGRNEMAALTAAQTYLLTRTCLSYEELTKFRQEALQKVLNP